MIRGRCRKRGHKFRDYGTPYVFCVRWFCDGSAVADWVWLHAPGFAEALHDVIPEEER